MRATAGTRNGDEKPLLTASIPPNYEHRQYTVVMPLRYRWPATLHSFMTASQLLQIKKEFPFITSNLQ